MKPFRKKIFAAAGYNTTFFGPGRKEFNPKKPMRSYQEYLEEAAGAVCEKLGRDDFDEGVISNFMAPRYLRQGNIPGFLPSLIPSLYGKPCTATEGACGSGGRAIATAARSILSDQADAIFVTGFEVQHTMKAVYGADVLAGAGHYCRERKEGHAHFFPGIFAERAGAYFERFDAKKTREAMARWYEISIINARKNKKAQEYHNVTQDLFAQGSTTPNADRFVPHINLFDCSKVSDGASALALFSEEGLNKFGIKKEDAVELVAIAGAEGNITQPPADLTTLSTTKIATAKALEQAGITKDQLSLLELHDCFTITGILGLEAWGFAEAGKGPDFVIEGKAAIDGEIPINPSGGLGGFGHPVGATGIRQLVDLIDQLTGKAENPVKLKSPFGAMVSMGGNDITVTAVVAKKADA